MSFKTLVKRILYPGANLGLRTRRKIARNFLTEPNSRTMDVGSGNGFFAGMACRKGSSVLSVSFDPDQIARCKAFQPYLGCTPDRLEFRVMDAVKMDEMTEQFDQILLLEVIEHLDDDLDVVTKLARRLKPGGIMHISTPDCRLGKWVGTLDRHAASGHARLGYSDARMYDLPTRAGLDVAWQTRMGGLGVFLTRPQNWLHWVLGGSDAALTLTFLFLYPLYLLIEWIPIPDRWRIFHYVIARRRVGDK